MTPTVQARRSALADDLRSRVFRLDVGVPRPVRFGVEVELLPVDRERGRPVIPEGREGPSTRAVLDRLARRHGWKRESSGKGAPAFRVPGAGSVNFEPGGQLEYSSTPASSADGVLQEVEGVLSVLGAACRDAGVSLLTRGIDPENPPEAARRVLQGRRYSRLAEHLARIGPAGRRMMLQTAAVHVNLDLGSAPALRWRVANRLTPFLTATFANSSRYRGEGTGYRSFRSQQWRELDGRRTGVLPGEDPVEEYLRFALEAEAILLGDAGEPARPYRSWLEAGRLDQDAWSEHLTTLFPEVRPRGYLEFRAVDALPPRWLAAPVVFLAGILYDDEACSTADELLSPPTAQELEFAGRRGVLDPTLRCSALRLWELALEGAERLGPVIGDRAVEVARTFRDRYTRRGRDPAADPGVGRLRTAER